ncbi:MAG: LysR family transcriptional regulator [Alphaproteobacteria bacterium]|nr:LysR family transcriptional regulator [Alphaproteobacteria bacterium]
MVRPYDFSSLTALVCFEAAARALSFKLAAQELNITPAAISHQIKALESDLACKLFERHHRGVELTEKGLFLFHAAKRGFETLSEAVLEVRGQHETVDVTVATSTAVSSLWLTPKISSFWKTHPATTVSQIIRDVPVMADRCDLSIHYGNPPDDQTEVRTLFQDRIIAVGTARFTREHQIAAVKDLLNVPLIHSSTRENDWTTWNDWFQALGYPKPNGRNFFVNNYMIALQTTIDDVGAMLGWDGLVGGLIRDGRIVQLVPDSIPSPSLFYLKIHKGASPKARAFADWLVSNA